jgi:hypothetical protein
MKEKISRKLNVEFPACTRIKVFVESIERHKVEGIESSIKHDEEISTFYNRVNMTEMRNTDYLNGQISRLNINRPKWEQHA